MSNGVVMSGSFLRTVVGIGFVCLVGLLAPAAFSQEGVPSASADEIFARKILMDTVDAHMDALDFMLSSDKPLDLARAVGDADTISVMLMTLPHLFASQTNQWRPNIKRNPARDTFASPDLWVNFADFYERAQDASRVAAAASRAKSVAEFKTQFESLRSACDACHALYVKADE